MNPTPWVGYPLFWRWNAIKNKSLLQELSCEEVICGCLNKLFFLKKNNLAKGTYVPSFQQLVMTRATPNFGKRSTVVAMISVF